MTVRTADERGKFAGQYDCPGAVQNGPSSLPCDSDGCGRSQQRQVAAPSKAMMNSPPPRCLPATSLADYQRVASLAAD
jgi:hypothetical protein